MTCAHSVFGRFFRGAIFHQLDPEHEAFAADVADDVVLFLQALQAGEQVVADVERSSPAAFRVDDFEHRLALRQTTGLPPKVLKWIRCASAAAIFGVVTTAPSGRAVADAFRHGDDVGNDALRFEAPEMRARCGRSRSALRRRCRRRPPRGRVRRRV